MNRLILTPIVFLWAVLTAQAQFYNNGLITNTNNLVTDYQMPWVNAVNGIYTGTGGVFDHRGPSVQTFTNDGTYAATAGHTDLFSGPGGSPGAQEIAGSRPPVFYNLYLSNGSNQAINITNTAGILVNNGLQFSSGIVTTVRTRPTTGALQLGAGASYTGGLTDTQHVNGYVSKTGNTAFTFPVGSGTDVRTLTMSAPGSATDQYTVAWIAGNPTTTTDPTDAQPLHSITSLDESTVNRVSPVGQWDWVATSGTGAGLNISVSIPDMTTFLSGLNEFSLRLVGWNGTRWINLSTGVKPYREGTSYASGMTDNSTLDGTLVAGITAIGIGFFRTGYPLGGTVFYDGNGLRDGRVEPFGNAPRPLNGTDVDPLTAGAQPLYTTLINSNGVALLTVPVTAAGTFSFSFVTPDTYSVVLSNNPAGSTVSVLPGTVMSTGERLGSGGGNDGTPDGIATGINLTAPFNEVNFAVNRIPIGKSTQVLPQSTPDPGVQVPVSATAFGGIDLEDGPYPSPENSTYSYDLRGREVTLRPATNGTVYYAGNPVSSSLVIPDFEPDRVTVSVANAQTTSVSFQYTTRDQAGFASGVSLVTLPFTGPAPSISGIVYDDGNGRMDGIVNGTPINGTAVPPINGAPVPLYVSLVQNLAQGGTALITTVPVTASGTYSFTNLPVNTSYNIVLTTNPQGSVSVSSLPTDWASTGEIFGGLDIDGTVNGVLTFVRVNTTPVTGANFGINRRPQVSSATDVVRLNPAGAVPVSASLLIGSDLEDGVYPNNMLGRTVSLSAATGGTLFHNGQRVSTVSVFINGFSPSGLTVDPTNPDATTVTFAYQIQDNAGVYSAPGIISVPFVGPTVSLSGQVFDDGNGLTDNLVNQTGNGPNPLNGADFDPAVAGSQSLFATLVGSTGTALGTVPVTATGTYSFTGVSAGTYSVVLGTSAAGGTTPVLPGTWVNTGEKLGSGPGSDGTPDGILTGVVVGTTAIGSANFGINRRPEGATASVPPQPNPGGSTQATIPATAFTGTDLEDGLYANNLTGREVTLIPASGGTLYYAGNPVSTTTAFASFDPTKVTVDPTGTQATTVQFTYLIKDNAGTASNPAASPSFITASFTGAPIVISGTIFDDANGQTDNTVNGTLINGPVVPPLAGAPVPLYVSLALETTLIATVPVTAAGTYSFSNVVGNRAYNLILTTKPAGDIINSTLPAGWVNTGAFVGTGPGNTGSFPGVLGVSVGSVSVSNANFGIDRKPETASVRLAPVVNADSTAQVPVPATAFTGTDLEDGLYPNNLSGQAVTLFAAVGGTLYYSGSPVSTSLSLNQFIPGRVAVTPAKSGETTVLFTYRVNDKAGIASDRDTITVPFYVPYTIGGFVLDDGNGLTDNTVNGTNVNGPALRPINGSPTPLYVSLWQGTSQIGTQPVDDYGAFSFTGVTGNLSYYVVLGTNPAGNDLGNHPLPNGWVHTGEIIGFGKGDDGTVDGVAVKITPIPNKTVYANFGINRRPEVPDANYTTLTNPGGNEQVPVPARAFRGADLEDGVYPDNLAGQVVRLTPATGGTLYYEGSPVSTTLTIDRFDPTEVTVDPTELGSTKVFFTYSVRDSAQFYATPGLISLFLSPSTAIFGTVFNDRNGLTDGIVNGTPVNGAALVPESGSPVPLYVSLWQGANQLATVPVSSAGVYSFSNVANKTSYYIVLGTNATGNDALTHVLPNGWVATGENRGLAPGDDGTPDGVLVKIAVDTTNLLQANFGIDRRPLAQSVTLAAQVNPAGNAQAPVSATAFIGSDAEDGSYASNLTGRSVSFTAAVGGTLYYAGAPVSTGGIITGFDPTKVTVDPTAPGSATVTFTYAVYDDAAVPSLLATLTLPFTAPKTLSISGRVFDDGNGLTDRTVNQIGKGPNPLNGTDIDPQVAGNQPVYAVLYRLPGEQQLAVQPVTAGGTYSFTGLQAGSYAVMIDNSPTDLGSQLWPGWKPTGEHVGNGPGDDGQPDATLFDLVLDSTNIAGANFGINKRPLAQSLTLAAQSNPGGSSQVLIPASSFVASDLEDGTYANNLTGRRVVLQGAVGGRVYYNGQVVTLNLIVDNFEPGKVTVDPDGPGATSVAVDYYVYDDAGVASEPATITLPFAPTFSVSGHVFDDGNGLTDRLVNQTGKGPNPLDGTDIDPEEAGKQPLYAILYDNFEFPQVLRAEPVTSAGTYSFTGVAPGTYFVTISTQPSRVFALWPGWHLTGQQLGTGVGNNAPTGIISGIVVSTASVGEANFGIDKAPKGAPVTTAARPNPGDANQVPVPASTFTGTDLEDGIYANNLAGRTVLISEITGGSLYYQGEKIIDIHQIDSFDPTKLTVDPSGPGDTTVRFNYYFNDAALDIFSDPVAINIPFTAQQTYSLSGRVVDDGNGLTDDQLNPTGKGPNPLNGTDIDPQVAGGQPIYAVLLGKDEFGSTAVLSVKAVTTTGTYAFTGLVAGDYQVAISTDISGNRRPALPAGWAFIGEKLGTGTGSDGSPNGILTGIKIDKSNVSDANFGINKRPQGAAVTLDNQPNPGGSGQVVVPASAFTGSDLEDGIYPDSLTGRTVVLRAAMGGTLFYNAVAVTDSLFINRFNPASVTVDPAGEGTETVRFTYTVRDNGGIASDPARISLLFRPTFTVSGHVFDDGNGMTDNQVNQTGLGPKPLNGTDIDPEVAGAQPLYVVLYDNPEFPTFIRQAAVTATGTYSLTGVPTGTYSLLLNAKPSLFPEIYPEWQPTGQQLGTGPGTYGFSPGHIQDFQVTTANVSEANFGIDKLPQTQPYTVPAQPNQGRNIQVRLNPAAFNGHDLEDGFYPNSLFNRKVELQGSPVGTVYYDGVAIPFLSTRTIDAFNPDKVSISTNSENVNEAVTVAFYYAVFDNAGLPSELRFVEVPFTANAAYSLSGHVFNDGNGLRDNLVNQTGKGPNPLDGTDIDRDAAGKQPIFALLFRMPDEIFLAAQPVTTTGTYSFTGLPAGTYQVMVTKDTADRRPSLPANWIATGEQLGTGPGDDGITDGRLTNLIIRSANLNEANFGIDKRPQGADVKLAAQPNPNGRFVPVDSTVFTGTDLEDGLYKTGLAGRRVVLGGVNATNTLFYDGDTLQFGRPLPIANFDPAQLTVKPLNQRVTDVIFTYSVYDDAGVASLPSNVSLTFTLTTPSIVGHVFDDGNALSDERVNPIGRGPDPVDGGDIDPLRPGAQPLFAALLVTKNGATQVLAVQPVDNRGTYRFDNLPADFQDSPDPYSVLLSTDATGKTPMLPQGWVNTGEHLGTGSGNDGKPDGILTFADDRGAQFSQANFGINRIPQAEPDSVSAQGHPGRGVPVAVPEIYFVGSDLEDGAYGNELTDRKVILSNVTGGKLYYNGQEVVVSQKVARFNSDLITIALTTDNDTTVRFDYTVYDDANEQSPPATVTVPFSTRVMRIAGHVFNDGNGLADNQVNQQGRGPNPLNGHDIDPYQPGDQALFAVFSYQENGASRVVRVVPVDDAGSYEVNDLPADFDDPDDSYSVFLSTDPTGQSQVLPQGWASTGEHVGAGNGSDGRPDGRLYFADVSSNYDYNDANFGIDRLPEAESITLPAQRNPGRGVQVTVPTTAFVASDLEDGAYADHLTDRQVVLGNVVGGTVYYNGQEVVVSRTVQRFDPTKIRVAPMADGVTSVHFDYTVYDDAEYPSQPATITLPFTRQVQSISGYVYNDGNGLADNRVNQQGRGPNPLNGHDIDPEEPGDQALFAVFAYQENGVSRVVHVVPVDDAGSYEFDNLPADFEEHHESYSTFISTDPTGETQSLPQGWASTGEHVGAGNGSDGRPDGRLYFADVSSNYDYNDANFGIDRLPEAESIALPAQRNPGRGVQVTVPTTAFVASDLEDGEYADHLTDRQVVLASVTGGTLYYNGQEVAFNRVVQSFDPTRLTVAPAANGATSVRFDYAVYDEAGYPSQPATITQPFTMQVQSISGYVYNDGNGSTDNTINGTGVNGPTLPVFATLIRGDGAVQNSIAGTAQARIAGTVQATVAVKADGSYSFTEVAAGTYSVVLTTNAGGSSTASLPPNWVNTGEKLGSGPGSDGTTDGVLSGITVETANVGAANFGIDRKPVVTSGSMPVLSNPGGTNQSPVFAAVFGGSDPEDGTYANNLKGREVTLTAAAGGTLYYNGNPVGTASVITGFDPAQVKLDPTAPKQTVATFTVAVKDNAGVLSDPKPIVVPFSDNHDDRDENDDPDKDDGSEDPDDDDDGDNDNDGKQDDRTRLPTDIFKPILPTILLPPTIGIPPIFIGILIPTFPINVLFIIINGTVYTKDTFPPEGVIIRTDDDGDLEDDVIVEPEDPTKPVPIPFKGIDPTGTPITTPGNSNIQPATLINNGPLSCTNTTVTLTAGGTGTYRFSSGATQANGGNTATVSGAGTYYVIVTGPNGYQARAATVVTADQSVPAATLTASGPLSCSTTSVTLTAGGGGTYRFGAGATQIGTGPTATVTQAGLYEVTVTAANGCKATASVRVNADQSVPAATLTNNGPLSCTNTTVTLTAGGVGTYRFSAGATPVAGSNTATVTQAGVYSVTVTSANGCSATAQTTVRSAGDDPLRIINQPVSGSTVTVGAKVTASVSVTGTGPAAYQWYKDNLSNAVSGQTSAVLSLSNVQLADAGRYFVVVSGPCNTIVPAAGAPVAGAPAALTSTAFTLLVRPKVNADSLTLTLTASPTTLLATGTTTLSATVQGGTNPYSYTFSGPGMISQMPDSNTATASVLTVGVQTFTVVASDATLPISQTISATVSVTVIAPAPVNTPPVATTNASQTATVGIPFAYTVNAFTDAETPNSLTYTASISPVNSLTFNPATRVISGVPSMSGVVSVTVTAIDSGSLSASNSFSISVFPVPVATTALTLVASASPTTLLTTGTTTLSATVQGGTNPYSYTFSGPGTISQMPDSNTATASGLTAGVQTFTVVVRDATLPISQTASATVSVTVTAPTPVNTPPVATTNASQTATIGVAFSYTVNAFADAETPNSLTYTASISPANGLTFNPATRVISGVPSLTGVSNVTITATDSGSLSATTSFTLTVNPASVSATAPFAIVGVTPVSCQTLSVGQRRVSFTPQYVGLNGDVVSFSVVSELAATTSPGPYTLNLYTDNPVITLKAVQSGAVSSYAYNWLGACSSTSATPGNTAPTVVNVVSPQSATVGVGYSLNIASVFTDAQTPNSLVLSASGLPAGLRLSGSTITGSPSTTVGSPNSVTVTATDPGGLSASVVFALTVSPSSLTTTPGGGFAIVGVTPVSCQTLSAGQRRVSFTPQYAGLDGSPVSFSVVSELAATTSPGPYALNLYTDNPVITLKAVQSGVSSSYAYNWLGACSSTSVTPGNTAPIVVNAIPPQSATVGIGYSLSLTGVFTDAQTPNSLVMSASGLPAGLSLNGTIISGTPSTTVGSPVSVTVTATDPGELTASTVFVLTVNPFSLTSTPTGGFAIVGVTPVSCQTLSAGQRRVSFTPQYAGLDGSPVSFSVVSELAPTAAAGPYTLNLYTDNPLITLNAQQTGVSSSYAYNWLSACNSTTVIIVNTPPMVAIPLGPQSATVGVGYSLSLERVFTDSETPNRLLLTATGLPSGLNLTASTLVGTPRMSGAASLTLTATDPGGLSTSIVFVLTVSSPGGTPPPSGSFSITGVTPVSCQTISAGQRRVSFTPQYVGLNSDVIYFSVVSELAPTTNPGPYTLNLYTDNPVIRLEAAQDGVLSRFSYNWLAACTSTSVTPGNTAPTVVNGVSPQSATVGVGYTLSVGGVFTDAETPSVLTLSTSGLPVGLSLTGTIISGTPSMSGVSTVTLTASDPGSLSVSTSFVLTVSPSSLTTTPGGGFAIVGVTPVNCQTLSVGQRRISFTPQYVGLNGDVVSFSVVSELASTTSPGPYTLNLYTDNPVITLKAVQSGLVSSFAYNWLSACISTSVTPGNTAPTVVNVISPQSATAGVGYTLGLANVFTDSETPNNLVLSASGLPAGLTLTGTTISGTPSLSGTSMVVLTASDPGSLSVSTSFMLMVSPASSVTLSPPSAGFSITGVQTLSCVVVGADRRAVTFLPQYTGVTGQAITFSVANELAATTTDGPYTLQLYTDNPLITLKASQAGTSGEASFSYNWLAACGSANGRRAAEQSAVWQVVVLGNPVLGETVEVEVRGAAGESLQLEILNAQGYRIDQQVVEQAGGVERIRLHVGASGGAYLLRVISPTQRQTLKIIKR